MKILTSLIQFALIPIIRSTQEKSSGKTRYSKVSKNLEKHTEGYPEPEYLTSIEVSGKTVLLS